MKYSRNYNLQVRLRKSSKG